MTSLSSLFLNRGKLTARKKIASFIFLKTHNVLVVSLLLLNSQTHFSTLRQAAGNPGYIWLLKSKLAVGINCGPAKREASLTRATTWLHSLIPGTVLSDFLIFQTNLEALFLRKNS